jgi:hypothetical protein
VAQTSTMKATMEAEGVTVSTIPEDEAQDKAQDKAMMAQDHVGFYDATENGERLITLDGRRKQ